MPPLCGGGFGTFGAQQLNISGGSPLEPWPAGNHPRGGPVGQLLANGLVEREIENQFRCATLKKTNLSLGKECWCIPPQGSAEFICAMEDVGSLSAPVCGQRGPAAWRDQQAAGERGAASGPASIVVHSGSYLTREEPEWALHSIDHIAMPTANAERLMEFYKRMGFASPKSMTKRPGARVKWEYFPFRSGIPR